MLAGCVTDDPDDDLDSGATPTSTNGETATPGSDGTSDPATSGDDASGGGSMEGTTGDEPMDSDDSTGDSESDSDSEGESTGEPTDPGPDLRELGPHAVDTSAGTAQLSTGCSMGYDLRTPAAGGDPPVVVLAHGFQGNRGTMAGWAEHWASWGVTVITPDLCHATIFDSDHAQNGADLQALVDELGLGSVVYAGYSAGGLASVIATAGDAEALALLGLDMVDADDLGAMAAPGVSVPAFDILGEPSMCNTTNNGLAVFQAAGGQVLRVTEADHCDFQSPADFLCGLTCNGTNAQFDDETIAAAVRGLSTAVVLWQTGLEPTGAQWWTPGSPYYEELAGLGILQQP
ncbi:MAG: hypothetical protein AAGF11_36640 [Myxococcota bacterium]